MTQTLFLLNSNLLLNSNKVFILIITEFCWDAGMCIRVWYVSMVWVYGSVCVCTCIVYMRELYEYGVCVWRCVCEFVVG